MGGPDISKYRKEYNAGSLDDKNLPETPEVLFEQWLNHAIHSGAEEPLAMNLATSTTGGKPSARIVLLREFTGKGLVFYTNYGSRKGIEILENPNVATTFFWPALEQQIRIEGKIVKAKKEDSDRYFKSRPVENQISAIVSEQSKQIPSRLFLEKEFQDKKSSLIKKGIRRPENWGGYILIPNLFEFWQGRPHRLNDRIVYTIDNQNWEKYRLAP